MPAGEWWFWLLVVVVAAAGVVVSAPYRRAVAALRRGALAKRLVEAGAGRRVDTRPGGFWDELSWVALLLGAWVSASPWIWGYADADGAIATDVITGAAVIALTLAGLVLPSLNALTVLAGLWLVTAPWLVGYGDAGGPVGLSDTLAGIALAALGIAALASAARRVVPEATMPVGRVQRRP